jgi:glycogen debranching enzyme
MKAMTHRANPVAADDDEHEQTYAVVAAESLQESRTLTLKYGDTFAVFNRAGDIDGRAGSPEGVFHRDTRHLSRFVLTMGGARPMLLSATMRDDNVLLTCDLANPDMPNPPGESMVEHDRIHIRRSRFLWNGSCLERIAARNFDRRPRRLELEIAFAADFADVFEVRGARRQRRGTDAAPEVGTDSVKLGYMGLDDELRETTISFDPAPTQISSRRAKYVIDLAPGQWRSIFVEVACGAVSAERGQRAFLVALRDSKRALQRATKRAAKLSSTNESFNETIGRSVSDLYMLLTETPEGPYPYAGVPWFSTVFGRDALITALATLWLDPAIAAGVLGHLAATQATIVDPGADAEPGKILHEARNGEMAILGEVPFRRYYGSVDSTPLFVALAGAYFERTGDKATVERLWPHIEAALKWMDVHGDRDGDGFIEYGRQTADGLINQGWKDSHDSVFHADGSLAKGPIAIVEVQAYAYAAWRAAERIATHTGRGAQAATFGQRAEALRKKFDEAYFDDELGSYVLALDGDKKPCRVLASNAGHALFTGVALPQRAKTLARLLLGNAFFTGWGVRTLASSEVRYNPMSYHNGSVWPHDNALIAMGLAAYGYHQEAAKIFDGVFAASRYIDLRRLPELFCGFPRKPAQGPTFYPVACSPQAWAAATPLSLVQSCIGLGFDSEANHIIFREPTLPSFLNDLTLHDISVGGGSADIALRRSGRRVVVDVLARRGSVRVVTID